MCISPRIHEQKLLQTCIYIRFYFMWIDKDTKYAMKSSHDITSALLDILWESRTEFSRVALNSPARESPRIPLSMGFCGGVHKTHPGESTVLSSLVFEFIHSNAHLLL